MKRLIYIMAAMLAAAACACTSDSDDPQAVTDEYDLVDPESPLGLSYRESRVAEFTAPFGWKLFAEMAGDENLVLSPLSAEYALAMLANGASRDICNEILETLYGSQVTLDQANVYYYKLSKNMSEFDSEITFTNANSLWYIPDITVKSDYRRTVTLYFGARAYQMEKSQMVDAINNWSAEKTNGMIPKIVSDASDFMLVNSIYFLGPWVTKFNKENTHTGFFHSIHGDEVQASYMVKYHRMKYNEDDGFCVVSLPIGSGKSWKGYARIDEGSFWMDFILPNPEVSLKQCIETIINRGYAMGESREIKLTVPKFSVNSCHSLKDALSRVGISKALESETKNPGISDAIIELEHMVQSASLKIDEEGVAGAATSNISFAHGAHPDPEWLEITIDRPFLFCVRECSTGECLFIGQVTKM